MRKRACLVCIAVLAICAPMGLRAEGGSSPAAGLRLIPMAAAANSLWLPSIPAMGLGRLAGEEPAAAAELFDESALDLRLVLLAAWLPIAAAFLALLMEDSPAIPERAREPGGEISLD